MAKNYIKRYLAIYTHKELDTKKLLNEIEKGLNEYLGAIYPLKILQIKFIEYMNNVALISFYVKNLDPHLLIPLLSLIRIDGEWVVPLLTSGTIKSLRESLKERYPELVKG